MCLWISQLSLLSISCLIHKRDNPCLAFIVGLEGDSDELMDMKMLLNYDKVCNNNRHNWPASFHRIRGGARISTSVLTPIPAPCLKIQHHLWQSFSIQKERIPSVFIFTLPA